MKMNHKENAQTTMIDEIIVDNFAGGGGASTGIELATGRVVIIAINHSPEAILMHRTNHPYTEHYQVSVWDVDPREVCMGRPVGRTGMVLPGLQALFKGEGFGAGRPEYPLRALLNKYCGYHIADDEVLLISIRGAWYYISDIVLRMLTPRELYNAMGFPKDYIIDVDYLGNAYKKSKQVERCGNAVCPPMAEAVVRANLPEWCGKKIRTMEELIERVAV